MVSDSSDYLFKHHPETCDENDIWGQVKRTVGGKPVPPEQVDMIVAAIRSGLELRPSDRLLDLCCGNGALTSRLFAECAGGVGVDYSEFLIKVANDRFREGGLQSYVLDDALHYVRAAPDAGEFTKVLCYGAFPYFGEAAALELLDQLHRRFPATARIFLGQLPDRSRMAAFYEGRSIPPAGEEDNPGGLLGVWRTDDQMAALARRAGWTAQCVRMPDSFYAAHYRFDAILTRA